MRTKNIVFDGDEAQSFTKTTSVTFPKTRFTKPDNSKPRKNKEEQGREAWTYLHTTDDSPEVAIVKFEAMIPSYGCSCKSHYAQLKADYPPDMADADSFFRWGWFVHNSVNEKLIAEGDTTKTVISLDDARKTWNRPAPME